MTDPIKLPTPRSRAALTELEGEGPPGRESFHHRTPTMNILQSILRAIRGPIIRFLAGDDRTQLIADLAGDDLVIVGDVYGSTTGPAPVFVPANCNVLVIGNLDTHNGPAVVVPRGCKPPAPTIRAVTDGDWGDARTWTTAGTNPAMVYGSSQPQAGEGQPWQTKESASFNNAEPTSVTPEPVRTPSDRLALAICSYRPSICNEPCLLCRAQSATVACELAAILRERHGGSSAVADWLDGVGAHCDKPAPLTEPQKATQNIEKGCSQ